jgi:hypothetical protein
MRAPKYRLVFRTRGIVICAALLVAANPAFGAFQMLEAISPNFGTWAGGASGRQLLLNTDDTVGGLNANDYFFGAVSGLVVLRKTAGPAPINIVAENITTLGGLSVNGVPCQWRNLAPTTCHGPGINVTVRGRQRLRLGVDAATTQFHNSGDTASVTLDITVTFL